MRIVPRAGMGALEGHGLDFDGDAAEDLLVSAYSVTEEATEDMTDAYLHLGPLSEATYEATSADLYIDRGGGHYATSVGDLDGDGYDDLVLGMGVSSSTLAVLFGRPL